MKALPRPAGAFPGVDYPSLVTSDSPTTAFEPDISLSQQLAICLEYLEDVVYPLPEPYAAYAIFFSVAAPEMDVSSFFVRRPTFKAAWREGATRVRQWAWARKMPAVDLRIDWAYSISRWLNTDQFARPDASLSWTLTDDDVEYVDLTVPLRVESTDPRMPGHAQASQDPFTRVLRLRGLHIDPQGRYTTLPREGWCVRQTELRLPLPVIWNQLSQQREDGKWHNASSLDHVRMTYTLLQIERKPGSLPRERISAVLERALKALSRLPDTTRLDEMGLRLLTVKRYLEDARPDVSELGKTLAYRDKLEQDLRNRLLAAQTQSEPLWRDLAMRLVENTGFSIDMKAAAVQAFLTGLQVPGATPEAASNLAIALLECLETTKGDLSWVRAAWTTASRQLSSIVEQRMLGPEVMMFVPAQLRQQAAFLESVPSGSLLTEGPGSAQVMLTILALHRLVNA